MSRVFRKLIILGFCVLAINCDVAIMETPSNPEQHHYSMFCKDIKPQHSLDIDQIMGLWYGSEIIAHTESIPGTFYYNTCVVVHLADITNQIPTTTERIRDHYRRTSPPAIAQEKAVNNKYLRLVWDEKDNKLEYTLNYTDVSPGLWTSNGDQRGTMLDLQYKQFSGTIQVVKVVQDHLVLTFCDYKVNSSFFTIVLSRKHQGLSEEDLRSIRNLLSRRGLSTDSVRKVCSSGAITSTKFSILLLVIAFLVSKLK